MTRSNHSRRTRGLWPTLLLLACGATQSTAEAFTLVQEGQSASRIIIAEDAGPAERYAATELQRYLEKLTTARLLVVPDDVRSRAGDLLIGPNPEIKRLAPDLDTTSLGPDEFVWLTQDQRLIIVGGRPRGTINGVMTWLEEQCGIRWFTPNLERIPMRRTLSVPDVGRRFAPALEYREVFWTEMMRDGDFAARHRLNGPHHRLEPRHGGPIVVYHPFVHSFDALIPQDLFETHPEYFPLIEGERKGGYVQRCLTHPDVLRLATDRVRQWIREHPEANVISVSQNDTFNYCQCERCQALDNAEGSPCASLLAFVNAIAANIEPDHPDIRIDTLAYQYTRRPPKTIRPRANVIIRLCSIECCFAHPLGSCPSEANAKFRNDVESWQPVAPTLYVWDYTPNFAHYQQIFPNFGVLQTNVQFYVQHGVTGLFEQGNYSPGGGGEMAPLRAYVLAKLLWDSDTDVDRHIQEFTDAYYGHAAPRIRELLAVTHRPVQSLDCHAHIFDRINNCYLSQTLIAECERLLQEALELADDEGTRFRVKVATLPIRYTQLSRRLKEGAERTHCLDDFLKTARQAGITHISERKTIDQWETEMRAP